MKKRKMALVAGAVMLVLSACGQTESAEETQKDAGSLVIEKIDDEDEVQKTQAADSVTPDSSDGTEEEEPSATTEGDVPEKKDSTNSAEIPEEKGKEASDEAQTKESAETGNPLYEAFLKNEISEFEDARKKYAYVDVNADDNPELIFKISSDTSELMYILGVCDNELTCFDVFESHTRNISFSVYDYGLVWEIQNYDGFEMTLYSYTEDGQQVRARHFTEENEADMAAHEGEEPEWIDWQYH